MLDLYSRRAQVYDPALWLYPCFGFRLGRYRRLAIEGLSLRRGDTVVDLGCGTGLNFPLLKEAVGPGGTIIGVDLTAEMLAQARHRVQRRDWENVYLVQADLAGYLIPGGVDGVLSTLAITTVPEYDDVIHRASQSLKSGRRMAIFELKRPDNWPSLLIRFGIWLNKPWGVSLDYAQRHPWKSMRRHFREVSFQELYWGAAFVSVGEAPGFQSRSRHDS